jgi:two-component system, OmpR family, sensor histidine kinase MtrB
MTWRLRPRGLRARLSIAFVAVVVLAAAAAAGSGARSASSALVTSTERWHSDATVSRVGALAPQLTFPLDQAELDRLRNAVGVDTLVTYQDLRSDQGTVADLVTDALRDAVRDQDRLATQRVTADGRPWLLIGMPIMITEPDGSRAPSGVEVYAAHDLSDVDRQVDGLTRSAVVTAALALPLALLLALLASGSVLRPVRDLRDTARRLAAGDLDARSSPQGADELATLTATVNEMAESLQTSMAAMQRMQADARRFAADVSHELRTPLSTLIAVLEVLQDAADAMGPDARESADLAIAETHRLVRLVEDLVEVSRFDAGTAQLRGEDFEVVRAVQDCLRARGWLDRVELTAPDESWVRLDRRRLDVIVANLVGNALRHGRPPVRVHVTITREQVRIEVYDHGAGLPAYVLPHVFERFYKADSARTRTPGSGLGLAIAAENARLHGGGITADNVDGGGACFVLRLPRKLADT